MFSFILPFLASGSVANEMVNIRRTIKLLKDKRALFCLLTSHEGCNAMQ